MGFQINRNLGEGFYDINKVFSGLEDVKVLQKVYGDKSSLTSVLNKVRLKLVTNDCYMFVDDSDGCVVVGLKHLNSADERTLYLDIIHELVHVKQFVDGRDIYDKRYSYVERQTEIEAYQVVVDEARKLGMSNDEIMEYLTVDWISEDGLKHLANRLGITRK
ncbi:MAG: hypothetical protein ACE5J2_06190 [Nitrososphaerales archaeon]